MHTRSRWTWLAALAAAAATMLALHTVRAQDSAPARKPAPQNIRTAVCNAYEVMKEYAGIAAVAKTLDSEKEDLNNESLKRKKEIDDLRNQLSLLNEGTEPFKAKVKEIDEKVTATKAWEEAQLLHRKRLAAEAIEKGHKALEEAVAAIAAEQGFNLVFNRGEMGLSGLQPDEMQAVIRGQRVLYGEPSLDITQQVLERMNAEFAKPAK
jgi:Skp family chaperone for outer membrane proteins